jgi:hypothetical protein
MRSRGVGDRHASGYRRPRDPPPAGHSAVNVDLVALRERQAFVAVVAVAYVAVILLYPLFGGQDISAPLFLLGWLGSSFVAGLCVPRDWMLAVPVPVGAILIFAAWGGLSESELLSDALSSVAVIVLTVGEIVAVRVGIAAASALDARRRG